MPRLYIWCFGSDRPLSRIRTSNTTCRGRSLLCMRIGQFTDLDQPIKIGCAKL